MVRSGGIQRRSSTHRQHHEELRRPRRVRRGRRGGQPDALRPGQPRRADAGQRRPSGGRRGPAGARALRRRPCRPPRPRHLRPAELLVQVGDAEPLRLRGTLHRHVQGLQGRPLPERRLRLPEVTRSALVLLIIPNLTCII